MAPANWDDEEDGSDNNSPAPAIVARKKFDDEEDDEDVLESWDAADDSEAEREKAQKAAAAKAKAEAEAQANKKPKSQRIEERRNENMRRKAAAEEDQSSDEDEATKRARARQAELDADMSNAADLFGGVGGKTTRSAPAAIVAIGDDPADPANAVDLASLRIFNPQTRDQFVTLRETLVPLLASNAKKAQYAIFMQDFAKELVADLPSARIKEIGSALTTLSNVKMNEEKAAEKGGKKSKAAKTKTTLNATRDTALRADTTAYDDDGLGDDDFM